MFEKLFNITPEEIDKNCIILPMNDLSLFSEKKGVSGLFFKVVKEDNFTVISLKNRWLAGDLTLLLAETPCENLFLFGSCGGVDASIGTIFIAEKMLNLESFSGFLSEADSNFVYPSEKLNKQFLQYAQTNKYIPAAGATISSLYLENNRIGYLKSRGISFLDMECSMVFSGAVASSIESLGLFYTTDIPGELNFYDDFDRRTSQKISSARREAAVTLINFINDMLS